MSASSKITYILVTLTIDPKDTPTLLPVIKDVHNGVTSEPENFLFEVLWDENDPGVYTLVEGWSQDTAWLATVQAERPYYVSYVKMTEKFCIHPRTVRLLHRHPDFGHLTNPKPHQNPSPYTFFIVAIYISPDNIETFLDILRKTSYAGVVAENECFVLEVLHADDEPGVVRLVEGWTQSKEWCEQVQMKKPYYAPYLEKTEKMWIKPRELLFLERKEGFGYLDERSHELC